jgi:hypothetical protein
MFDLCGTYTHSIYFETKICLRKTGFKELSALEGLFEGTIFYDVVSQQSAISWA